MIKAKYDKIIGKILATMLLLVASYNIGTEIIDLNYKRDMEFYNYYVPLSYPKLSTKELCMNCELKIPKIIHRVWFAFDPLKPNMPDLYKKYDKRFKELHPDWKIMEWNEENSLEFIKQNYPEFLSTYYSYAIPMQRLDALRYLLVHHYGGLTIQHSFYVEKNLEPLLRGSDFVVFDISNKKKDKALFITAGFFASTPKHPILTRTIEYLMLRSTIKAKKYATNEYILLTTGPILFSDAIYNYLNGKTYNGIKVLDESFLSPFNNSEKLYEPVWSKCIVSPEGCSELYPDAYAFTIWAGSWMK